MSETTRIIYVGGASTNASASFDRQISDFKQRLRDISSALVLEWKLEEGDGTKPEMYDRDLNNIRMCDVLIALIDEPSIGLGMEIAEAIRSRKTILCLHSPNITPSRLLQAGCQAGFLDIATYRDLDDA